MTVRLRSPEGVAVGARVSLFAGGQTHVQELRAGSAFLSQSSKTLFFGLGSAQRVERLDIRWPSGRRQTFADLPVQRGLVVTEGESTVETQELGEAQPSVESTDFATSTSESESVETWLLEPASLPPLRFEDDQGQAIVPSELRGAPSVLALWSPTCAVCLDEFAEWRTARGAVPGAGRLLAVTESPPEDERLRSSELARRLGVTPVFAGPETLLALAVFLEEVARWPRALELPATLLLDGNGRVVKLYRGRMAWETIARDGALVQAGTADSDLLRRRALPFDGRYYATSLRRNYFQMGVAFSEAGVGFAEWAF